MERITLDGRLGFSVDVTPEELKVLAGEDREAAKELLVKLVQSEHCEIVGDTYFPVDWNEEVSRDLVKEIGLDNFEIEERLAFDLPEISMVDAAKNVVLSETNKELAVIEGYRDEYLAFLKECLEEHCNENMCCEVYWDYRDELDPSTLKEAFDKHKEAGYATPKDYLENVLWERNFDYDNDMFHDIENDIENCDNEHVVEYFDSFGNVYEDAQEAGYNGIDVNLDELLRKSEFKVNLMFATDEERNFDMGSIVSSYGSWRDPDFEYLVQVPEALDNALTYFIHQQGHSVKEVYECLLGNPRGFGSKEEMAFAKAIVNECVNNSSDAMSELTALVKLDGNEFFDLVEAVEKGEQRLTFSTDTMMGIYNEWVGGGGLLELQLDKPFVVSTSMVRNVQVEGAPSDWGYTVDKTYGLIGSCWKETMGYTDEKPVLYEEDLAATVKDVQELIKQREAEELVGNLDDVIQNANERSEEQENKEIVQPEKEM